MIRLEDVFFYIHTLQKTPEVDPVDDVCADFDEVSADVEGSADVDQLVVVEDEKYFISSRKTYIHE